MYKAVPFAVGALVLFVTSAAHADEPVPTPSSLSPAAVVVGSGAALFATGYGSAGALGLASAFADHPHIPCDSRFFCAAPYETNTGGVVLLAPVVGPLMLATSGAQKDDYLFRGGRPNHEQTTLLYADVAMQTAGLTAIGIGAVMAAMSDHTGKPAATRVSLVPVGTKDQPRLCLVGTF